MPKEPVAGPRPSDQVNFTDEESRIMPVSGGGFDQCYNSQAVVAEGTMLIMAAFVTQETNDKKQVAPMLKALDELTPSAFLRHRPLRLIRAITARLTSIPVSLPVLSHSLQPVARIITPAQWSDLSSHLLCKTMPLQYKKWHTN
ncbi:MAG: hypothetical protein IPH35_18845 [Rhodoferax sp.]|nr:hypothetical protein [Rhodoferax sp.]